MKTMIKVRAVAVTFVLAAVWSAPNASGFGIIVNMNEMNQTEATTAINYSTFWGVDGGWAQFWNSGI